ncbi:bifunctional diaminohydroxyphosphoribosylaminopyrimidine deaminase/5-amino-6-(5-phosphoribosylamino)uracil reductase RibD [Saccharothrix sp. MB29]|nr:bifunctional diaminohydroxyphosphoribosylaminopyrimidine deaminase/5-amino-6-(5-phosphoribosylamino)uracil reductase RibD [Saccharothrix sp. MB29]
MHRAVVLSAFGLGTTSPNPPVGCVILDRHHRPVGEGHHVRKGEAHAEVHALRAAGEHARGGTAVVTLEPCNHHGRTPPCRQALLDAGIARVLIAVIDPTSREEGGAARLAAAGADVEIGLLADSARTVLRPWLHSLDTGRPHVTWLYELDPREARPRAKPRAPHDAEHATTTACSAFMAVLRRTAGSSFRIRGTAGGGVNRQPAAHSTGQRRPSRSRPPVVAA